MDSSCSRADNGRSGDMPEECGLGCVFIEGRCTAFNVFRDFGVPDLELGLSLRDLHEAQLSEVNHSRKHVGMVWGRGTIGGSLQG